MLPTSKHKSMERDQHSRYVELCALLTTGTLNPEDLADLDRHLSDCAECRRLVEDFHQVLRDAMPLLASREGQSVENVAWHPEKIKRQLLAAIENQGVQDQEPAYRVSVALFRGIALYVACFFLVIFAAIGGYIFGSKQHPQVALQPQPAQPSVEHTQFLKIEELTRQRDSLEARAKDGDRVLHGASD